MSRKRNYRVNVLGTGREAEEVRYSMFVYGVTNTAAAKAEIRANKFRRGVMRKYHTSLDHGSLTIQECSRTGEAYRNGS